VVRKGDVVATLEQPELELQIQHKREELGDVASRTATSDRPRPASSPSTATNGGT
jgi:hypothetical protein